MVARTATTCLREAGLDPRDILGPHAFSGAGHEGPLYFPLWRAAADALRIRDLSDLPAAVEAIAAARARTPPGTSPGAAAPRARGAGGLGAASSSTALHRPSPTAAGGARSTSWAAAKGTTPNATAPGVPGAGAAGALGRVSPMPLPAAAAAAATAAGGLPPAGPKAPQPTTSPLLPPGSAPPPADRTQRGTAVAVPNASVVAQATGAVRSREDSREAWAPGAAGVKETDRKPRDVSREGRAGTAAPGPVERPVALARGAGAGGRLRAAAGQLASPSTPPLPHVPAATTAVRESGGVNVHPAASRRLSEVLGTLEAGGPGARDGEGAVTRTGSSTEAAPGEGPGGPLAPQSVNVSASGGVPAKALAAAQRLRASGLLGAPSAAAEISPVRGGRPAPDQP